MTNRRWLQAMMLGTLTMAGVGVSGQSAPRQGVLLLAHGGAAQWNERVEAVRTDVDATLPTEVAFGMASRATIQGAVDRLTARGVTDIVAVPLFVSSWSSVVTATEYLLGVRPDAPADLALFAKMDPAMHGAVAPQAAADPHAGHAMADPSSPVTAAQRIRITAALNRHAIVGQILTDRARTLSRNPAQEAVVLVAHGPSPEADNQKWLADMAVLAGQVQRAVPFMAVDYLTVRDDAGEELREQATRQLRGLVAGHLALGRRVLIVPHLMSFGGIELGIQKRLAGLAYDMAAQGLMPDPRMAEWVRQSASALAPTQH